MTATTPSKPAAEELRWITAAALAAMATRGLTKGSQFMSTDLQAWVPEFKTRRRRMSATTRLCALGIVTCERLIDGQTAQTTGQYTVTARGAEAIQAAAQGRVHKSGPKGPHTNPRARGASKTFAARLWALMRARKILDAETAATTLVDAGGDVTKAAKTARRYLHHWVKAGALQESVTRVNAVGTSNGFKRYVLVNDCGPTPPARKRPSKPNHD